MVTGNDCLAALGEILAPTPDFFSDQIKQGNYYLGSNFKCEIGAEGGDSRRSILNLVLRHGINNSAVYAKTGLALASPAF